MTISIRKLMCVRAIMRHHVVLQINLLWIPLHLQGLLKGTLALPQSFQSLLVHIFHLGCRWALLQVSDELAQTLRIALGFALNLGE